MAKHSNTTVEKHTAAIEGAKEGAAPKPAAAVRTVSDGYESVPDERFELAGFWAPERGPLHGVLLGGFEYVQKSGKSQGELRKVYVFKLIDPCEGTYHTYSPDGRKQGLTDGELAPDDLVGVFDSADLRRLRKLKGAAVKLARNPVKKALDNGNEMWTFDIRAKGRGTTVDFAPAYEGQEAPF